ncbi:MAG: DUF3365 domain-containing protein [Bdellovibrionales bacterium]|nr:DUF3365 domain-containing protein [Bdellovibrionales bacterium]
MKTLSDLCFKSKLLCTVALSVLICGSVSIGVAMYYKSQEFKAGLVEKSRIVHSRLDAAAKFVAAQGGLEPIIETFTSKYDDPSQLTEDERLVILKQVPIYAAMEIGARDSDKDHYSFRVFSDEPRNKKNAATAEEMKIFNRFLEDPKLEEIVQDENGFVTVFRPVHLKASHGCFTCHGAPSTSPWKNGKDILGYQMEDWKEGKLHGVFAISNDTKAILKAQSGKEGISSTLMLALFIALGGMVALFISALVIKGPIGILAQISKVLSQSGVEVDEASKRIASSSQALSEASTEQASSLEETAASLEEISSMIEKALESADLTASSSLKSQKKAEEGKASVNEMLSSMNEISQSNTDIMNQVNASNQQMSEIVHVINEIGSKTKVINEIVFQTKLLSFNASVEAARAGEHGKGFAVVAEEVGSLAEMSGNAAKEITTMLESSILKVEQIAENTKSSVESLILQGKHKVDSGVQVANQCSEVLSEIVNNVSEVSKLSQEISQACREQALGVREINKAMGQLDTVTQNNTSTSHATAVAADELSTQARELKSAVAQLVAIVSGPQKENGGPFGSEFRGGPNSPDQFEPRAFTENPTFKKESTSFLEKKAG